MVEAGGRGFRDFDHWERAAIGVGGALFIFALSVYPSHLSLTRWIFGINPTGERRLIGKVTRVQGEVQKQLLDQVQFEPATLDGQVFDQDTWVTGPSGSAKISLDDGTELELAPNTMIQLDFAQSFLLGNVYRPPAPIVRVIQGEIREVKSDRPLRVRTSRSETRVEPGQTSRVAEVAPFPRAMPSIIPTPSQSAVPSPVPTLAVVPATPIPTPTLSATPPPAPPLELSLVLPRGQKIAPKITELTRGVPVQFKWSSNGESRDVILKVERKNLKSWEPAVAKTVKSAEGTQLLRLSRPGTYRWTLSDADRAPESLVFSVLAEVQGLVVKPPKISGELTRSNNLPSLLGKEFALELAWDPWPGATRYRVRVRPMPGSEAPRLDLTSDETQIKVAAQRVFTGALSYEILTELDSGFTITSGPQPFKFSFLPPLPLAPPDGESIERVKGEVVFSWQKMPFATQYEIEISRSEQFKTIALSKTTSNNYLRTLLDAGDYYWRVSSISKEIKSRPCFAQKFRAK